MGRLTSHYVPDFVYAQTTNWLLLQAGASGNHDLKRFRDYPRMLRSFLLTCTTYMGVHVMWSTANSVCDSFFEQYNIGACIRHNLHHFTSRLETEEYCSLAQFSQRAVTHLSNQTY